MLTIGLASASSRQCYEMAAFPTTTIPVDLGLVRALDLC